MAMIPDNKPKRRKRRPALTLNILTRTPDGCIRLERRVTHGTIILGLFDPPMPPELLARTIPLQPKRKAAPCR